MKHSLTLFGLFVLSHYPTSSGFLSKSLSDYQGRLTHTLSAASIDPSDSVEIKVPKQLKKKALTTFPRYLEIECWKRPELRGLEPVLQAVAEACKQINRIVQRAQTDDVYGVALDASGNPLEENVQGEVQQKLDVLCNTIMMQAFCGSSCNIHSVASEEEDKPRCCSDVMVRFNELVHLSRGLPSI